MARKQPGLPDRATPTTQKSRVTSGIIGGILLGLGGIWLGWLFLHQFGGSYLQLPAFPLTGFAPTAQPGIQQIAPLRQKDQCSVCAVECLQQRHPYDPC